MFFPVWNIFPCSLLHITAKTYALLNCGRKKLPFALLNDFSMVLLSGCGWGDQPIKKCNHQWIRCARCHSQQQPNFPINFLFWSFRHRLVRSYLRSPIRKQNYANFHTTPCEEIRFRLCIMMVHLPGATKQHKQKEPKNEFRNPTCPTSISNHRHSLLTPWVPAWPCEPVPI